MDADTIVLNFGCGDANYNLRLDKSSKDKTVLVALRTECLDPMLDFRVVSRFVLTEINQKGLIDFLSEPKKV